MEKKTINFSLNTLVTKFHNAQKESFDPNTLWRAVLWGLLFGVIAVGIFAYSTYNWALGVETPSAASRPARDGFSLTELRNVIAVYHQKEVNYQALLNAAPQPPDYQHGRGAPAPLPPAEPAGSAPLNTPQ